MLVIWGRNNSLNVQKVLWCCEEMSLPYQRSDAGAAFGVVDTPAYRELNPNGLVPTIEDDGFVLWESNAIVRYLAAKHAPGSLWPDDAKVRADADRWMDWKHTTFWPAFRPAYWGLVRTPPGERDLKAIEESRLKAGQLLQTVDHHLAKRDYLAGNKLTIGDIPLGCAIWRWMSMPLERPALPNVERWFNLLTQRTAYQKTVMLPLT